jgi:hypothetical protein
MSESQDVTALLAEIDSQYRDDLARELAQVGKPVERRLLSIATNEQLQALETIARESRERITGGPGGVL